MNDLTPTRMMIFHFPEPPMLEALGMVAVCHAHLDHILKMTIKSVTGISIQKAMEFSARKGAGALREKILKEAKRKLGEGEPFEKVRDLLERCENLSNVRNRYLHDVWSKEIDGNEEARMLGPDNSWNLTPSLEDVNNLVHQLRAVTNEINGARLNGWLKEAIAKTDFMPKEQRLI